MKSLIYFFAIIAAFVMAQENQILGQCLDVDLIHPTAQNSDGSISIEVNCGMSPYNFEWEGPSGESYIGSEINNLSSGSYCVTITDHLCGSLTKCFVMNPFCTGLEVIKINWHAFSPPSACGTSDGFLSIRVITFNEPVTIQKRELIEISTGINLGNGPWVNLSSGLYRLNLTTLEGCIVTHEFIFKADDEHIFDVEVNDYCSGIPGSILIYPIVEDNNSYIPYTLSWSTGEVCDLMELNYCEIGGLIPGEYCVTITNDVNSQCSEIRCFTIDEIIIDQPINAEFQITQPCPMLNNGALSFEATGGVGPPYSITLNPQLPVNQLSEGIYVVTISDACGNTFSSQITLVELKAEVVGTDGCIFDFPASGDFVPTNNPGTLSLSQVWGGTPDYQYSNLSSIEESGLHCLTVSDQNNCTLQICDHINVSSVTLIEVNHACAGINSGSVKLKINNPNSSTITLMVDNNPFEVNELISIQELVISGLEVGIHTFLINFDNDVECGQFFNIEIKESQPNLVFAGYEDGDCIYNEVCNDEIIGINSVSGEAVALPSNNGGCRIDYFCNGLLVDSKSAKKRTMNFWQYELLLFSAAAQGIIPFDLIFVYISSLRNTHACDDVRFCTATFEPTANFHFNIFGNRDYPPTDLGNGCYKRRCGLSTRTFCPGDYLVDIGFNGGNGLDRDCIDWIRLTMKQLSVWKSQMEQTVDNFYGSQLYNEIINWEQLESSGNMPDNILCRQVIFCKDDLNLVSIFDPPYSNCTFSTIECVGSPTGSIINFCSYADIGSDGVLTCPTSGTCTSSETFIEIIDGTEYISSCIYTGSCVSRTIIYDHFPRDFFSDNFVSTISNRVMSNIDNNLNFEKFDYYYNQDARRPVSTYFSDISDTWQYQEYSIFDPFQSIKSAESTISRIVDFEKNHEFRIEQSGTNVHFLFESDFIEWDYEITGNYKIKIEENIQVNSSFFIIGSFEGLMGLQQSLDIIDENGKYFFIEVNQSGNFTTFLQSISPISLVEEKINGEKILLLYSEDKFLSIINRETQTIPNSKLILFQSESSRFLGVNLESLLVKEPDFYQIDYTYDSKEENFHMIHEGVKCQKCQYPDDINLDSFEIITYSIAREGELLKNRQMFFPDLESTNIIFFNDTYGEAMVYISSKYDWIFGQREIPLVVLY